MKNKLLFTTALVAVAFAASGALAEDKIFNSESEQSLAEYAKDEAAHQLWVDNVTVDGVTETIQWIDPQNPAFIQANNLNIKGESQVTVDRQGAFIGGKNVTIEEGSTVKLTNGGHIVSSWRDNGSINVDGTVEMESGIIRASHNEGNHSSVNISGDVKANNGDNYIASVETNISGGVTVAESANLGFYGDMKVNRTEGDPTFGFLDGADEEAKGTVTVAKGGTIDNLGTVTTGKNINLVNDGIITNGKELNLQGGYSSNGGQILAEAGKTSTIKLSGDINLQNNAQIIATDYTQAENDGGNGEIKITDAGTITLNNGSIIDAVELTIDGADEINISGNNPEAGRNKSEDDDWRNNAYILGYDNSSISNAKINLGDGGMLIQGAMEDNGSGNTMTLAGSTVNVASGGLMKATNGSNFTLDNSIINLSGRIEGIIKTNNTEQASVVNAEGEGDDSATTPAEPKSVINVNSSDAYIAKIESLDELNINADASNKLFGEASVTDFNVASGSTFTLDKVTEEGGKLTVTDALNVDGTFKLADGVAHNTDYSIANTNVNSGGVLDVTTNKYESIVTLNDGASLNIGFANVVNESDEVTGIKNGSVSTLNGSADGSASVNLVFANDIDTEQLASHTVQISEAGTNQENITVNNNLLFDYLDGEGEKLADLTLDDLSNAEFNVAKKDAADVAAGVAAAGANGNQAGAIAGFTAGKSGNAQADSLTDSLSTLIQSGNVSGAAEIAEAVAPHAAAMVRSVQAENLNQAYGAVSGRLSGGAVASAAEGKASGDSVFEKAAVWVQGLFNKSKLDDTSKARGFDADSTGLAFGAEKQLDSNLKAGVAYAYTDTDVDGHLRKTEIDTHTVMAYGEYKPSNWFVNGIASYGWSDYTEKKFGGINAKYDVDTYGLQAMTGYDMNVNGYDVTPEAGLRYVHISQDAYTDDAGQRVSANDLDILTAVAGAKVAKDFELSNGMNIRPEARLAMTYDLANDKSNSVVSLANGSAYTVEGDALDRFGVEAGLGVTADIRDNLSVSAGYEGKFRDHYEDHTGLLSAKYKF